MGQLLETKLERIKHLGVQRSLKFYLWETPQLLRVLGWKKYPSLAPADRETVKNFEMYPECTVSFNKGLSPWDAIYQSRTKKGGDGGGGDSEKHL